MALEFNQRAFARGPFAFWEENLIFPESLETKAVEQRGARGQIESNAIGFCSLLSAKRRETHSGSTLNFCQRPKQPFYGREEV